MTRRALEQSWIRLGGDSRVSGRDHARGHTPRSNVSNSSSTAAPSMPRAQRRVSDACDDTVRPRSPRSRRTSIRPRATLTPVRQCQGEASHGRGGYLSFGHLRESSGSIVGRDQGPWWSRLSKALRPASGQAQQAYPLAASYSVPFTQTSRPPTHHGRCRRRRRAVEAAAAGCSVPARYRVR